MDSEIRKANSGWWDGGVGYEIYIRSFADSNGDGVGDLSGFTRRQWQISVTTSAITVESTPFSVI